MKKQQTKRPAPTPNQWDRWHLNSFVLGRALRMAMAQNENPKAYKWDELWSKLRQEFQKYRCAEPDLTQADVWVVRIRAAVWLQIEVGHWESESFLEGILNELILAQKNLLYEVLMEADPARPGYHIDPELKTTQAKPPAD